MKKKKTDDILGHVPPLTVRFKDGILKHKRCLGFGYI